MASVDNHPNSELACAIRAYAEEWRSARTRRYFQALARRLEPPAQSDLAEGGDRPHRAVSVPAGETSHGLSLARQIRTVIRQAHDELDQGNAVLRGMRYPLWIGLLSLLVVLLLSWVIFPVITVTDLDSLGGRHLLPSWLRTIGDHLPAIAIALVAFGVALRLGAIRVIPQFITDRIPVVGKLLRATSRAQFLQMLSALIARGEPIDNAVKIAGAANSRPSIRRAARLWSLQLPEWSGDATRSTTFRDIPFAAEMALRSERPAHEKAEFLMALASNQRLRSGEAWRDLAIVSEPVAIVIVGTIIFLLVMVQFLPLIHVITVLS